MFGLQKYTRTGCVKFSALKGIDAQKATSTKLLSITSPSTRAGDTAKATLNTQLDHASPVPPSYQRRQTAFGSDHRDRTALVLGEHEETAFAYENAREVHRLVRMTG